MSWLRFPRILGIVACAYFLLMAGFFVLARNGDNAWVQGAEHTTGEVVGFTPRPFFGSSQEPSRRADRAPTAPTVRYTVNGSTYTYTPAHGHLRSRYVLGDRVEVLYDSTHPDQARLRAESTRGLPVLAVLFALLAAGTAAALVATRGSTFGQPPGGRPRVGGASDPRRSTHALADVRRAAADPMGQS